MSLHIKRLKDFLKLKRKSKNSEYCCLDLFCIPICFDFNIIAYQAQNIDERGQNDDAQQENKMPTRLQNEYMDVQPSTSSGHGKKNNIFININIMNNINTSIKAILVMIKTSMMKTQWTLTKKDLEIQVIFLILFQYLHD